MFAWKFKKMNKRGEKFSRLIAVVIVFSIISLLIYVGPANAFTLGMSIDDSSVTQGESFTTDLSIEVEEGEFLAVDNIMFILNNFEDVECEFDVNGSIISGCENILIEVVEMPEFNYGYGGFEAGMIKYRLTINTENINPGIYRSEFKVISNGIEEMLSGDDVEIRGLFQKCSIRAGYGVVENEALIFDDDNHFSMYITDERAAQGQGSLTAQKDRNRLSYGFDVLGIIRNNNEELVASVVGEKNLNRQVSEEEAIITYNKVSGSASIEGETFTASGLEIGFKEWC